MTDHPPSSINQSGQTVIGQQINIAGDIANGRALYAGLTAPALHAACQAQVKSVLHTIRSKYDPDLYVHRAIETELNAFFDQPLADPSRSCYLIIAPAGSGKTNLLCDLAQARMAQQPVMLLLGGSAYLSGRAGLLGAMQSELEAISPAVSFQTEADSLHALYHLAGTLDRDALILLDAINEYDQPAQMRKAVAELFRHTRNQRVKLVITCRDFYWNLFKGPFWDEVIVNAPIADGANAQAETDQADGQGDFYHFASTEQAQALTLYLHHYKIVGRPVGAALDQCRHPLLLRFFCEAYRGQTIGDIEDIRLKELFDRYWDQKLLSIAERRLQQGEERLQAGLIDEVASYLLNVAGYMLHHNERSILLTKLPEAANVTELMTDPRSLYGRIRDEFIILEEQERGKSKRKVRQIAFVYEEFMEYVMARALLQRWDDQGLDNDAILHELDKLKDGYRHFSQILGVMVYLAIMLKEEPHELALWSFLINSGAAWRGVVFEAFKKLPEAHLDAGVYAALLDLLQGDESVQLQVLDLLKIERIGNNTASHEELFTTICALAIHTDERLARRATLALQYSTDVRAIHSCIRNLGHRSAKVRHNTAETLLRIGGRTAEPLMAALKDEDAQIRQGAAFALGRGGDTRAVEPLIAALKDQAEEVRQEAASALKQLGDERAVEPLIAAGKDQAAHVRQKAVSALGQLGDARAVEPLIAALKDQDEEVRQKAVPALGQLGDARAVEPLIAALKDQDEEVRQEAASALGQLGDIRAVEPLMAALKDEDTQERREAATALGQLGDARAVEPLIAALKDQDEEVRRGATAALKQLDGARAVEALIAVLKDEDAQIRCEAVSALGELGGTDAVEPLIVALKDQDVEVRREAVATLGKLGDVRAVEPLMAALKDQDGQLDLEGAFALALLASARSVEALIAALKHEDTQVRLEAVDALGRLGDTRALKPLIDAHDNKLVGDELFACALARFQPQDLQIFASRLNDADATVRQSTQQLLDLVEQRRAEFAMMIPRVWM